VDPLNITGTKLLGEKQTKFNDFDSVPPKRVSMSVPITLAISHYSKNIIENAFHKMDEKSGKEVALVNKHGQILAILKNPEIYENRKEEIITRTFGVIDKGHPYISYLYKSGHWNMGGEVELLGRIR
jgi:3'-phosphoadenosine 5'-phosphosulfate synthase